MKSNLILIFVIACASLIGMAEARASMEENSVKFNEAISQLENLIKEKGAEFVGKAQLVNVLKRINTLKNTCGWRYSEGGADQPSSLNEQDIQRLSSGYKVVSETKPVDYKARRTAASCTKALSEAPAQLQALTAAFLEPAPKSPIAARQQPAAAQEGRLRTNAERRKSLMHKLEKSTGTQGGLEAPNSSPDPNAIRANNKKNIMTPQAEPGNKTE